LGTKTSLQRFRAEGEKKKIIDQNDPSLPGESNQGKAEVSCLQSRKASKKRGKLKRKKATLGFGGESGPDWGTGRDRRSAENRQRIQKGNVTRGH